MSELGALRHLTAEIAALEKADLLRTSDPPPLPAGSLVLCSNDYLGYAAEPWPKAPDATSGAGASRLVSGNHGEHLRAEEALACWLGFEGALLFSSGYAANVGTLAALARPGDVIVSDAFNHASLIDGCRLSGASVVVVPHGDASAVESALKRAQGNARRWVITESYFSMEGDSPDLEGLRAACDRWDAALVVDEAHAVGTLGPEGRGLCAEAGIRPDVLVGTLGKALGLQGAFVAGSRALRTWLWNRARSFVFSTGISPALCLAIQQRVRRVAADEERRRRLREMSERLRLGLGSVVGDALLASHGPILPCLVGDPAKAVGISRRLRELGVLVQAIRPPTVPKGTARLRVTAHAGLNEDNITQAVKAFHEAWTWGRTGDQTG